MCVLGIKSHKLFPTLFLAVFSNSNRNKLEISRGVWSGWSMEQENQGNTWISRWVPEKITIWTETWWCRVCSGQTFPTPVWAWLEVPALKGSCQGWNQPRTLEGDALVSGLTWLGQVVAMVPSSPTLGLKSFSLGVAVQPGDFWAIGSRHFLWLCDRVKPGNG